MINNGFTPDKDDYEFCTKVDNMIIPPEGFMGISAATGGLAGIVTPELWGTGRGIATKSLHSHTHLVSTLAFSNNPVVTPALC